MFKRLWCGLLVVMLVGGSTMMSAEEQAMTAAIADFEEWMKVIADFTRGVEFDEKDIRSVIELWPELEELDVMQDDETAENAAEFARDVREIVADAEYRAWARANGLDPETFLRRSMRVSTVLMMQQVEGQRAMAAAQQESYRAMVEQSCARVDAETCAEMRAGLEQSLAISAAMTKTLEELPPPTATELALLERYGTELEAVMMPDDEEDDFDDYEDYEDYDPDYDETDEYEDDGD